MYISAVSLGPKSLSMSALGLPFFHPIFLHVRIILHTALLRPVATGNWGCGAFGGDPQLKSMLQWMAVSAAGRAEMIYFPFSDKRMEQVKP